MRTPLATAMAGTKLFVVVVLSWWLTACDVQEESFSPRQPLEKSAKATRPAPEQRLPATDVPALNGAAGTLEGMVRFLGGVVPSPTIVPVGTDTHYCGQAMSKEDIVIDAKSGGIRYVFVRLTDGRLDSWPPGKPDRLVLDNKHCRFEPHAAVLVVGSTLVVHNSDPLLHTTHLYGAATFNWALATKGVTQEVRLGRPGLILVRCDKHGWMQAFLQVDRHPLHAVTDPQGRYRIGGIPAGEYTVETWHEIFGAQQATVSVEADQSTQQDFVYTDESQLGQSEKGAAP